MNCLKRILLWSILFLFFGNISFTNYSIAAFSQNKNSNSAIQIWNRAELKEETEDVYGGSFLHWIYGTTTGWFLDQLVLSRTFVSQLCGAYQSSSWSAREIEPFIQRFNIHRNEFEDGPFSTFNEFFSRKLKPGTRPFTADPREMPAFAEGRYLAYDQVRTDSTYPVKGTELSISSLMGSDQKAKPFLGGPMFIARLSPVDYHRFHFPDDGTIQETYSIHGKLDSVSPIALHEKKDIYLKNERRISILNTINFGQIAYIEIGALCVGKIVQTHPVDAPFARGDEKGYFLFGGSTVIMIGQPGRWTPDPDLLFHTQQGQETLIQLGTKIGTL